MARVAGRMITRDEVAEAAWRVILRDGLPKASMRAIATDRFGNSVTDSFVVTVS